MSVKLRVSGLLASVCLLGVVAGGAVFAQDAVVDQVAVAAPAVDGPAADTHEVDLPAVDAPTVDTPEADVPAVDAPAVDAVALDAEAVQPEAVAPTIIALAVPAPNEPTGYEERTNEDLAYSASYLETDVAMLTDEINTFTDIGQCEVSCDAEREYLINLRDESQNNLDHVNEEIRRRSVVVTPTTPEPTPVVAPAPVPLRDVVADAAPPREFCAALKASGSWSDCGYKYRQSLKQ